MELRRVGLVSHSGAGAGRPGSSSDDVSPIRVFPVQARGGPLAVMKHGSWSRSRVSRPVFFRYRALRLSIICRRPAWTVKRWGSRPAGEDLRSGARASGVNP